MSERGGQGEKARLPPPKVDAPDSDEKSKSPPPPPPPPPPRPTRRTPLMKNKYRRHIGKPNQHVAAAIHYQIPIRRSSTITIERISAGLMSDPSFLSFNTPNAVMSDPTFFSFNTPNAVAIGPYHRGSPQLSGMEAAKLNALDGFCRLIEQSREEVRQKILPQADTIRSCYDIGDGSLTSMDDGELAQMMSRDGCFLLQFMVKVVAMQSDNGSVRPWSSDDHVNRRMGEIARDWSSDDHVNRRMGAIARDVLLLENQIPWVVLQCLMEFFFDCQCLMELGDFDSRKLVRKFLDGMAIAFNVGGRHTSKKWWWRRRREEGMDEEERRDVPAPNHLLGLFHRRQLGKARSEAACLYILPSLGSTAVGLAEMGVKPPASTAVELAEMGVKLTASRTKKFGDMDMKKRRWPLGLFGELSLAPLVLNHLTTCWLLNIIAYESLLGATQADNFAVSSYVFLVAHLVNREEDVQDLRARGIISSAMSDRDTFRFFKSAAPSLHIGDRYIQISQRIQEYKQERWIWIAIHSFLYNNIKIIVAVLTVAGVLVGLFKTILSLRQPQYQ